LLLTGWGSVEELCEVMLDADVYMEVGPATGLSRRDTPADADKGLPVFTSPAHIPAPRQGRPIPFDYLLNSLVAGFPLAINPETRVRLREDWTLKVSVSVDAGWFLDHRRQRRTKHRPPFPTFPNLDR
jgi:hypothetical protein